MTSSGTPQFGPWEWPITDAGVEQAVSNMLQDGSWGRYHGPHCDQLREALADLHNVDHVQLCSSGTAAIELALRAARVGPGDEVILAAYDYKANFSNVLTVGAKPVLIDTRADRPVMDPTLLSDAVTEHTKAIICSHLHGCLADVAAIRRFADEHQLKVIEDACQVAGATVDGLPAGTTGHLGALSFGGSKLLTAGRGGAVLTSDAQLAQRIRLYTQRGNDAYPLSEMQTAVLLPQLQQLEQRNRQRKRAVHLLTKTLPTDSPLTLLFDDQRDDAAAWYKAALLCDSAIDRDQLSEQCRSAGIPLDPGFSGLHLIHARSRFRTVGDLPHATSLHHRLLTLHHPVLLADDDQLLAVCATVLKFCQRQLSAS